MKCCLPISLRLPSNYQSSAASPALRSLRYDASGSERAASSPSRRRIASRHRARTPARPRAGPEPVQEPDRESDSQPGRHFLAAFSAPGWTRCGCLAAGTLDQQASQPATYGDLQQTGHTGADRSEGPRAKSIDSVTLSDRQSQGEHAPSRRYARLRHRWLAAQNRMFGVLTWAPKQAARVHALWRCAHPSRLNSIAR